MGGVDQYFSIIALFIIFRETIEASIIVSVLLQFLHRSFPVLKRQGVFACSPYSFLLVAETNIS
jgi:hypothetical protein